jgi:hypothetical protein
MRRLRSRVASAAGEPATPVGEGDQADRPERFRGRSNRDAQVPAAANVGETITLSAVSATAEAGAVPAVAYHWDLGDGTIADIPKVSHAYTSAGEFTIRLTVDEVDGVGA